MLFAVALQVVGIVVAALGAWLVFGVGGAVLVVAGVLLATGLALESRRSV